MIVLDVKTFCVYKLFDIRFTDGTRTVEYALSKQNAIDFCSKYWPEKMVHKIEECD